MEDLNLGLSTELLAGLKAKARLDDSLRRLECAEGGASLVEVVHWRLLLGALRTVEEDLTLLVPTELEDEPTTVGA